MSKELRGFQHFCPLFAYTLMLGGHELGDDLNSLHSSIQSSKYNPTHFTYLFSAHSISNQLKVDTLIVCTDIVRYLALYFYSHTQWTCGRDMRVSCPRIRVGFWITGFEKRPSLSMLATICDISMIASISILFSSTTHSPLTPCSAQNNFFNTSIP